MKYTFKIYMLTGEYSKDRVEEVLMAIDGVDCVRINVGNGKVTVECSEEVGLDVFAAAVEEAGYVFAKDKEEK